MKNKNPERFLVEESRPVDWFETLYSGSSTGGEGVPWANMKTHPSFDDWLTRNPLDGNGKSALVVGCGMGDDAVELESLGFQVTAFDVSESAIKFCRERFPQSKVDFVQADLLQAQEQWHHRFDFVLEIFTIQALPPKYEEQVIENISRYTAPGGQILVIAADSPEQRSFENGPPWVRSAEHIEAFETRGYRVERHYVEKASSRGDGSETNVTLFTRTEGPAND